MQGVAAPFKKDPHLRFTVFYSAEYHLPALSGKKITPALMFSKNLDFSGATNALRAGSCSDPPQPLILGLLLRKGGNEGFLFWISELKTVCLGREILNRW